MAINFGEIRKQISPRQIVDLMIHLGADKYEDKGKHIVFPTICHNPHHHEKSMKLYYYPETCLFRCYTECDKSFDIFDLWQRVESLNGDRERSLFEITDEISRRLDLSIDNFENFLKYHRPLSSRTSGVAFFEYESLNKDTLNFFEKRRIKMWESENINYNAIEKYNIRFYPYRNKIIIPHYNFDDNLIGIRTRNIEEEDIKYGKYVPLFLNNKLYSHPLSFNLYGLNISRKNISKEGIAYVFEGEKSCLQFESLYPYNNCSVATCGSSFNKFQLMLLKKHCDVREVVICFDRQFETKEEENKYYDKLYDLCLKYSSYCKMSFIFDSKKLLKYKNSPIDQGKEIFEKLLEERQMVRK